VYRKGTAQGMVRKNRAIERELAEIRAIKEMEDEE
jgi:hypothetical protein